MKKILWSIFGFLLVVGIVGSAGAATITFDFGTNTLVDGSLTVDGYTITVRGVTTFFDSNDLPFAHDAGTVTQDKHGLGVDSVAKTYGNPS